MSCSRLLYSSTIYPFNSLPPACVSPLPSDVLLLQCVCIYVPVCVQRAYIYLYACICTQGVRVELQKPVVLPATHQQHTCIQREVEPVWEFYYRTCRNDSPSSIKCDREYRARKQACTHTDKAHHRQVLGASLLLECRVCCT